MEELIKEYLKNKEAFELSEIKLSSYFSNIVIEGLPKAKTIEDVILLKEKIKCMPECVSKHFLRKQLIRAEVKFDLGLQNQL